MEIDEPHTLYHFHLFFPLKNQKVQHFMEIARHSV